MSDIQDFTNISHADLDDFIKAKLSEFDEDPVLYKGLDISDVIIGLQEGFAVVRKKHYGLVLTYIYAAQRGQGVGKRLLDLVKQVDSSQALWLLCYGDTRRDWFVENGFSIDPSDGEGYRMVIHTAVS